MERQSGNGRGRGDAPTETSGRIAVDDIPNRRRSDRHDGTLGRIGGACDPRGGALGRFGELAGGRQGRRIVGLTTASANPVKSAREWLRSLTGAGATHVEMPIVDSRDRAQDARVAEMLRDAGGI